MNKQIYFHGKAALATLQEMRDTFPNVTQMSETNMAFVSGQLEETFSFSHNIGHEKFFETRLVVSRHSGELDYVPILVSDAFLMEWKSTNVQSLYAEVFGELRSFNQEGADGKKHLKLHIFAKYINICENVEELMYPVDTNIVYLNGFLCKNPIYRKTPLSREITDLLIAVNRSYGKSDYIPAISWGRTAWSLAYFNVGDSLAITGRFQSRVYHKRFPGAEEELREVYELSVNYLFED